MKTRKETSPAYAPCAACGTQVLRGDTPTGTRVALDTHIRTYTVLWVPDALRPLVQESRGYPVHQCPRGCAPLSEETNDVRQP
jgi:hypothetical protein